MTDHFTDELAEVAAALGGAVFVNRTSRLVMDPERFPDDADEPMAARGMGAIYRSRHDGSPREALPYEDASLPRPPVCIGFDAFHVDAELRDVWAELVNAQGFEVGLNAPFAGSLVPMRYYREDKRVRSLMIELRRDLYLDEATGTKRASFRDVHLLVRTLLTAAAEPTGTGS